MECTLSHFKVELSQKEIEITTAETPATISICPYSVGCKAAGTTTSFRLLSGLKPQDVSFHMDEIALAIGDGKIDPCWLP
jgi:hypothetical protein